MIVTSIDLMNHLRCRRFSALHQRERELEYMNDAIVAEAFSLSDEILVDGEDSQSSFQGQSLRATFKALYQQEIDGVVFEHQTYESKFLDKYYLHTVMDFAVREKQRLTFYKVYPSTANHYLLLKYTSDKHKSPMFIKGEDGIYYPIANQPTFVEKTNYPEKRKRITSRHYDTGRIVYDLTFGERILSDVFPKQKRRYLVALVNGDFVLKKEGLLTKDFFTLFDMTELVVTLQEKILADLYRMNNHIELSDDSNCPLVKRECLKNEPFECEYTSICFAHIPKKNALYDYFYSHLGFKEGPKKSDITHDTYDLINEGMVDMLDIPIGWLQREKNLMQRYCVENNYTYYNKKKMKDYLSQLKYPLYFLDFESCPSVLPRLVGESPYTQSVFLYSLHRQDTPTSPLVHTTFLVKDELDHRMELFTKLIEDLGEKGSIIVYNETFERTRMMEASLLFPSLREGLEKAVSRLFDLLKLLKTDVKYFQELGYTEEECETYNFYHPDQAGSYSIKTILKILGLDRYEKLKVQNGTMAATAFLKMISSDSITRDQIAESLEEYCSTDTYAMVYVLQEMKRQIG